MFLYLIHYWYVPIEHYHVTISTVEMPRPTNIRERPMEDMGDNYVYAILLSIDVIIFPRVLLIYDKQTYARSPISALFLSSESCSSTISVLNWSLRQEVVLLILSKYK